MSSSSINLRNGTGKAVFILLCIIAASLLLVFAKWAAGHAIALNAAEAEVAKFGVQLAPNDPHAHFGYAGLLEKTLLPADQEQALREMETAAALLPDHWVYWLSLGRAREQAGNDAGAEQALRRALELAPNYARVQWALGNMLLRQGRQEEGFAEIRRAVAADASFANPAAAAAWQIFQGDSEGIKRAIGDSPRVNASVAVLLAGEKRYPEAMEMWRRIPEEDRRQNSKEAAQALFGRLTDAGLYSSAVEVGTHAGLPAAGDARPEFVWNGGFEEPMPQQNPNVFAWTISDGNYPRIGLNDSQKHGGQYSMLMSFGQGGTGSRQIAQKIGAASGGRYELQFFYRSDAKTDSKIKCGVVEPGGDAIAAVQIMPAAEWTQVNIPFTVPAGREGVELRIWTEMCTGDKCAVTGNVWFDDFSLVKL